MRPPTLRPVRAGPLTALLAGLLLPLPAPAQEDGLRLGITVGGTSFAGLTLEFVEGDRSVELSVGTWAAQDLVVSVVGRQYLGAGAMKPTMGVGLWTLVAWSGAERPGIAVLARAPVGFDWNPGGDHFLSLDINVNRGLWVQRTDPEDQAPMSHRLVPLPGLAYRWRP